MDMSSTHTSVYAFVCWIGSIVSLVIFLIWAFSTDDLLHNWKITYYPSRYYAVAIPAYLLVVFVLGSVMYVAVNFTMTNNPEDMGNIRDEHSLRAPKGRVRFTTHDGIPEVGDMDPLYVSRVLMRISDST